MLPRYTTVTVAHAADYPFLWLQARSMRIYCVSSVVDEIVVVENFGRGTAVQWREALLAEYGSLACRVRFVRAGELADLTGVPGWWSQQVLKMLVERVVRTERYVILDAKNHLVFPLTRDFLETSRGKPRSYRIGYRRHPLRPRFVLAMRYFGLDPAVYLDCFLPTTTPFTVIREFVQRLIRTMSVREGKPFAAALLANGLTEFLVYSASLVAFGHRLEDIYDFLQPSCPRVWPEHTSSRDCANAIGEAETGGRPFFAVHRRVVPLLDRMGREALGQFWHRRGLFSSASDAASFMHAAVAAY
jgi:Family of unknown function (DUF6492)